MSMSMVRRVALGSVSVVALTVATGAAQAQVKVYGGGATLPAIAYRQMFNCYANDVGSTFGSSACAGTNPGGIAAVPPKGRVFGYAPVGSGGGQRAAMLVSTAQLGTPSSTSNTVPYADNSGPSTVNAELNPTGLSWPYAAHHYSGSDALLYNDDPYSATATTQELNCYYGTNGLAACGAVNRTALYGAIKQVPTLVTTVNFGYNLPGGTSGSVLRLTKNQYCGLATGAITDWNDPAIKSGNAGPLAGVTSSTPIKFVTRRDGSGTTFLFVQHIDSVCAGWTASVNAETGAGGSVGTGGISSSLTCGVTPVKGASNSKIGNYWIRPKFVAAEGNSGVAAAVAATPFSIAYMTPELTQPNVPTVTTGSTGCSLYDSTGALTASFAPSTTYTAPKAARLQNSALSFRDPTPANAQAAMASASPPSTAVYADPETWAIAGSVPNPSGANSYPISGFTWWNGYTCYNRGDVTGAIRGWWDWLTGPGRGQLSGIAGLNGFALLPTTPTTPSTANWNGAVRSLMLTNAATQIARQTVAPSCAGVSPGA